MEVGKIGHYTSDMNILLVGEGDFSFASSLASAFQNAPRLVATSLDSLETLRRRYPDFIGPSLTKLKKAGAVVVHGVDVRSMASHPRLRHRSFDCIVFNFPHSGFVRRFREDSDFLIQRHRKLVRGYFENASKLVKKGGEVHVTHHVYEPYVRWKIEEEAARSGLRLVRTPIKFDPSVYPDYTNRRGAGVRHWGRRFPCHNAATFIFSPRSSTK